MCYKSPGPRCSGHAAKKMAEAKVKLNEKPNLETFTEYKEAEEVWLSTPAGIKELRKQGKKEEADKRKRARDAAIAAAKKRGDREDTHTDISPEVIAEQREAFANDYEEYLYLKAEVLEKAMNAAHSGSELGWMYSRVGDSAGRVGRHAATVEADGTRLFVRGEFHYQEENEDADDEYEERWTDHEEEIDYELIDLASPDPTAGFSSNDLLPLTDAERTLEDFATHPRAGNEIEELNEYERTAFAHLTHPEARLAVASDPTTNPQVLRRLSATKEVATLVAIASNPNSNKQALLANPVAVSNEEVASVLAKHEDSGVRKEFAQKTASPKLLAALAADEDWGVKREAWDNPATPLSAIAALYNDEDKFVREQVRTVRSQEVLAWMKKNGMKLSEEPSAKWMADIFG